MRKFLELITLAVLASSIQARHERELRHGGGGGGGGDRPPPPPDGDGDGGDRPPPPDGDGNDGDNGPVLFGAEYEAQSAEEKYNEIFRLINEGEGSVAPIQWERAFEFFTQRAQDSLTTVGDDMPFNNDNQRRQKLVHTQGLVAPVRLVPNPDFQPYTGLFTGGDFGFARISETGFQMEGATSSNPSAALKFLRDDVPSANMVFMESFNGQDGMDFFAPELSTHPDRILGSTCRQTVQRKLSNGTRFPFSQGTIEWSSTDQFGDETDNPVFPFEIVLRPTESLRQASAAWVANNDVGFGAEYFSDMAVDLLTLPIGEDGDNTIWDLMARAEPDDDLQKVGTIEATDSFRASLWADTQLFFKHDRWEDTQSRRGRNWETFENDLNRWDRDMNVEDLAQNRPDAMEVMAEGIQEWECPFAWLIRDIEISDGRIF